MSSDNLVTRAEPGEVDEDQRAGNPALLCYPQHVVDGTA